ncbi:GIY-YIG nuclease family protein [Marinomonas rhizomae]|uniref:Putative endonuclease n=1 Tax=Marinomonas rhizomae TaxID=491948 RepID=A0A366JFR3_9GAMM|nr:GIY-YIG nuclease family protein [Marinomonas rhizomae]RBP85597.1 putative endonuclease [Marinomonas rhizomae]RNF75773.1 GIY-YIG nuclease family protein [Marinomonas rhizomae]
MTDEQEEQSIFKGQEWSLYMIKTRLNTLYTGISTDVERRFKEHSGMSKRGARYLKGKGPLELVWHQTVGSKSDALVLEHKVKKLNRRQKISLINGGLDLSALRL